MKKPLFVSVVDDDESVRESLPDLLKEFGYTARTFASSEEFLASEEIKQTRCLILDIAMPGMGGPDLQRELERRLIKIPIIFITGQRDEDVRSRVLGNGAVAVFVKALQRHRPVARAQCRTERKMISALVPGV